MKFNTGDNDPLADLDFYIEEAAGDILKSLSSRPWVEVLPRVFIVTHNRLTGEEDLKPILLQDFYKIQDEKALKESLRKTGAAHCQEFLIKPDLSKQSFPKIYIFAYPGSMFSYDKPEPTVIIIGASVLVDPVSAAYMKVRIQGEHMIVEDEITYDKASETLETIEIIETLQFFPYIEGFLDELEKHTAP